MTNHLILGATGLIGRKLVNQLSLSKKTIALTRRKINDLPSNVSELLIDFDSSLEDISFPYCEHLYICLGTTIKKAGSKDEFKKVDFNYCASIAEKVLEKGAKQISLVSSVGANANSNNFYLKIKGMLIKKIVSMKFETINIYQPGLLIGKREENRFFEGIMQKMALLIDPLFIGEMNKYRSISADSIALHMTKSKIKGINYFHYGDIMNDLKN